MIPVSVELLADIVGGRVAGDPERMVRTPEEVEDALLCGEVDVDDPEDALAGLGAWLRDEHEASLVALVGFPLTVGTRLHTAVSTGRPVLWAAPIVDLASASRALCRIDALDLVVLVAVDPDGADLADLAVLLRADAVLWSADDPRESVPRAAAALTTDDTTIITVGDAALPSQQSGDWPAAIRELAALLAIPTAPALEAWEDAA